MELRELFIYNQQYHSFLRLHPKPQLCSVDYSHLIIGLRTQPRIPECPISQKAKPTPELETIQSEVCPYGVGTSQVPESHSQGFEKFEKSRRFEKRGRTQIFCPQCRLKISLQLDSHDVCHRLNLLLGQIFLFG